MNRDHPEKRLDFTVSRGGKILHIPVTPDLAADGGGRIGVSLAPNASITRRAARGIGEALSQTASEFSRLTSIVTNGARWHRSCVLDCKGALPHVFGVVGCSARISAMSLMAEECR